MPDTFAMRWGSTDSSKQAVIMALEMESWPQPAQRVESSPS